MLARGLQRAPWRDVCVDLFTCVPSPAPVSMYKSMRPFECKFGICRKSRPLRLKFAASGRRFFACPWSALCVGRAGVPFR